MFEKLTPAFDERTIDTPIAYTRSALFGSTAMSPKYQANPPKMPV
jgi:hypothetical protein